MYFNATFFLVNLAPRAITLALLCFLLKIADFELEHSAALIFLCRLAAIDIPIPDPQTNIPLNSSFEDTFLHNL